MPPLSSVNVSVPVRVPVCVGAKLALSLQLPPGGMAAPRQLFAELKFVLAVTPLMWRYPFPLLVMVAGCDVLVVPTVHVPKPRLDGETDALAVPADPRNT